MALSSTEQHADQIVLQAINIVSSIAGAVAGASLPGFLIAIPLIAKIVSEAKAVSEAGAIAGKVIPELEIIQQALANLGMKPMDANDLANIHRELEH